MNRAYQILLDVLRDKLGFIIIDNGMGDFTISDYIPDSLMFIEFIIAIEETIGKELPDDFLDNELLSSAIGFAEKLDCFMLSQQGYAVTE
ncbi:MAG: acyl carrier protein [Lachnospiraceae bacterium]|jgi:acyl carrier protein|nr:acyl carrier protein [Lachnospiraceae bacterium]